MRFLSYEVGGTPSYGMLAGDEVIDLKVRVGDSLPTLRAAIEGRALGRLADLFAGSATDHSVDGLTFRPPIADSNKVICVGLNYHEHRDETGRTELPYPTIFSRFADTHVGHGQSLIASTPRFDYEGELVVVIGRAGFQIDECRAHEHVAGYSIYNDGSARDWQTHTTQWLPGKNFPASGGFGPWIVTTDEIDDIGKLELTTKVNGEVRQQAGLDLLIFDVPQLVAYISTFTALAPGDLIVTGTPGGVGMFREPPTYLAAGDVVEVQITDIGTLRNPIAAPESG
jgi:2-keto-4-pentenoate hydratase/2-oxohepta-3-ene-1,7-dioic acid hydratase in catechol pathway